MVTVYTLPSCVQCDRTKKLLERDGIEYRSVDLSEDAAKAAAFKEAGFLQAPIVELADGTVWGGFRPDLIKGLASGPMEG